MRSNGSDKLSARKIRDGLGTRFVGQNVVYRECVASTNALAKDLADEGAPEGTLVIAEEQTAGRGRLGRPWLAPHGSSLLMSLVFRPRLQFSRTPQVSMICGLAVCDAIRQTTGLLAQLKWPNDILISGRKTGGILTETCGGSQYPQYVVVGIGLNVNLDPQTLPTHFAATSIARELGQPLPRLQLLQELLYRVEARYLDVCAGVSPVNDWSAALETLGQRVHLTTMRGSWVGVALAVDEEGGLLLRLDNGQTKRVLAGDITLSEH